MTSPAHGPGGGGFRELLPELLPRVTQQALRELGERDAVAFTARLEHSFVDLYQALDALYGGKDDVGALLEELVGVALEAAVARPVDLGDLDRRREIDQAWFQRARMVGYVCYVERFCGRLDRLPERLDYLAEMGVTYLHLMPLLAPRPGENDGGYAVMDYEAVDPRVGTMTDLESVARQLHARGMSLCIDLVLNHTAREHAWARGFRAGDPAYADFYIAFPDRTMPGAFEESLPEVFPDTAPGNFSWDEQAQSWIWTTFHDYQWDLNYRNPRVFAAMLRTVLALANHGVDVFRLDAVPFTWKRLLTSSQNESEAHSLLQALRALVRLSAPGVAFKAEAIVSPDQLVQYLGAHDRYRPECDLAYNNQLMVLLWSSLASQDAPLMTKALQRLRPSPPPTGWVTYVRGHDDIGWAVSDEDAAAVGWTGWMHRKFLVDFYAGRFYGSYATGRPFQENPATGDARISGMAAAMCGIDAARRSGDRAALEQGIRRLVLLYSIAFSYGGIPLIYMGDELALPNDEAYAEDPEHRDDNRWLHRPRMDWAAAARRTDPDTVEGRVFGAVRELSRVRASLLALRSGGESIPVETGNRHVFGYRRRHPRSGPFLALANFSPAPQGVDTAVVAAAGLRFPDAVLTSDGQLDLPAGRIALGGLGFTWLVEH